MQRLRVETAMSEAEEIEEAAGRVIDKLEIEIGQLQARVAELLQENDRVIEKFTGIDANNAGLCVHRDNLIDQLKAKTAQCEAWKAAAEYVEEYVPCRHGAELYKAARALEAKPLLCSYKSGGLLCSLPFPCVRRNHQTKDGIEFN